MILYPHMDHSYIGPCILADPFNLVANIAYSNEAKKYDTCEFPLVQSDCFGT
jgi:hypothetical protein